MPARRAATVGKRYEIQSELGRGGMGAVYEGENARIHRKVAIKILRSTDPEIQARFAQEVQVLANLHHANVVSALARGVTSRGAPYVALELVAGQSLRARLETGGPLPWREVVGIGVQLAGAVSALCSSGVVHRDLKPDNIMVTAGERTTAKLIDLGLASVGASFHDAQDARFTPDPPARHQTQLGHPIGTPPYSPRRSPPGARAPANATTM